MTTDDGPFGEADFPNPKLRYTIVNRVIDGAKVQCLREKKSGYVGWCYTAATGLPFDIKNNFGTARYTDFQRVGNAVFPTFLRVAAENGATILEGRLAVSEWKPVDASVFAPVDGAAIVPITTCANAPETAVPAHLVHQQRPDFPEAARRNNETGPVRLFVVIGKDGAVKRLDVVQSAGPRLDEAARKAVQQWRYSPYMKCGQPLELDTVITVNFAFSR